MRGYFIILLVLLLRSASGATDHTRPLVYVDERGNEHPVKTPADWARRRAAILAGMQQAMGALPDRSNLPPLDVKVSGQTKGDGFTRVTLTFVAEGSDRVPADLYLPTSSAKGKRRPAVLALHQTSPR